MIGGGERGVDGCTAGDTGRHGGDGERHRGETGGMGGGKAVGYMGLM